MDDLRAQIKVRDIKITGFDVPVEDFWAVLESWSPDARPFTNPATFETTSRTIVVFKFTKLEVIASSEPYNFPTLELGVTYVGDSRSLSRWKILADSIAALVPKDDNVHPLDMLVGKRQHWKRTTGHRLWDRNQGKVVEQESWEVLAIDGLATSNQPVQNPVEAARAATLVHLHGADERAFSVECLKDQAIRGTEVQQMLLSRTLLPKLVQLGVAAKDADGKYSVDPLVAAQWVVGAL